MLDVANSLVTAKGGSKLNISNASKANECYPKTKPVWPKLLSQPAACSNYYNYFVELLGPVVRDEIDAAVVDEIPVKNSWLPTIRSSIAVASWEGSVYALRAEAINSQAESVVGLELPGDHPPATLSTLSRFKSVVQRSTQAQKVKDSRSVLMSLLPGMAEDVDHANCVRASRMASVAYWSRRISLRAPIASPLVVTMDKGGFSANVCYSLVAILAHASVDPEASAPSGGKLSFAELQNQAEAREGERAAKRAEAAAKKASETIEGVFKNVDPAERARILAALMAQMTAAPTAAPAPAAVAGPLTRAVNMKA